MVKSPDLAASKTRLLKLLDAVSVDITVEPKMIREEVRKLASLIESLDAFSGDKFPRSRFGSAGKDRILEYMKLFVGEIVDGDELRVISGTKEYARRVRQLKVESGYDIVSGMTMEGMRPEQYKLVSPKPNEKLAEKWRTANRIRRMPGSSEGRVLEYLKARVGQIVESEELLYVAKKKDYDRRARALRSEKGWNIRTRYTGSLELTPTQYVLDSLDQLPEHDRKIPPDVYDRVQKRDGYKCVKCGWSYADRRASAKAQNLQVHHKQLHRRGGSNEEKNLATLCNVHHVEAHRKDIDENTFDAWLKS